MLSKGPYAGRFRKRRRRAAYVRRYGTGLITRTKQYGPGYQPATKRAGISPELKHYTTGLNLTALDTAPSSGGPARYLISILNNIAQGDQGDGRQGNKIQLKRITIRIKTEVDPNSSVDYEDIVANGHVFRVILFLDTCPNGGSMTWDTMFDIYPADKGQLYDYNNPFACDRFKILADRFITVHPSFIMYDGTNYHAGGNIAFDKFSIPLDCATWFSDGTNNLTSIQRNNVGMWICSDASLTAYPNMKFSYRSKLRYMDY